MDSYVRISRWINDYMDGWKDKWMNGWQIKDEIQKMDRWIYVQIYEWMAKQMGDQIDG